MLCQDGTVDVTCVSAQGVGAVQHNPAKPHTACMPHAEEAAGSQGRPGVRDGLPCGREGGLGQALAQHPRSGGHAIWAVWPPTGGEPLHSEHAGCIHVPLYRLCIMNAMIQQSSCSQACNAERGGIFGVCCNCRVTTDAHRGRYLLSCAAFAQEAQRNALITIS